MSFAGRARQGLDLCCWFEPPWHPQRLSQRLAAKLQAMGIDPDKV